MNEDFKVRTVVYNVNVAQRALLLGHGRPGPAGNGVIQMPLTVVTESGITGAPRLLYVTNAVLSMNSLPSAYSYRGRQLPYQRYREHPFTWKRL